MENIQPLVRSRPTGFKADFGRTYATIEQEMKKIRRALRPDCLPYQPLPMLKVFESLHRQTVKAQNRRVRLNWRIADLDPGVEGLSQYDHDRDEIVIAISVATYSGLEQGQGRAINTVGHEITHSFLHADQLIRISQIPRAQMAFERATRPQHRHFEDTEWQANAGAAALTMPAEGLVHLERTFGHLSGSIIQRSFGVSAEAALHRLDCFTQRRTDLLSVTKRPLSGGTPRGLGRN